MHWCGGTVGPLDGLIRPLMDFGRIMVRPQIHRRTTSSQARGVERCVGPCKLPTTRTEVVEENLSVAPEELSWAYAGLNHRGFLHTLQVDSIDVVPNLIRVLGDDRLAGISAQVIEQLQAVPLTSVADAWASYKPWQRSGWAHRWQLCAIRTSPAMRCIVSKAAPTSRAGRSSLPCLQYSAAGARPRLPRGAAGA